MDPDQKQGQSVGVCIGCNDVQMHGYYYKIFLLIIFYYIRSVSDPEGVQGVRSKRSNPSKPPRPPPHVFKYPMKMK